MRLTKIFISLLILLSIFSCEQTKKTVKSNDYSIIPLQTTYIFKINNKNVLKEKSLAMLNNSLNTNDSKYLQNIDFNTPFTINVLENNSKIKGFVAVGNIQNIDSIFNGKTYEYEQHQIHEEVYKKQHYYAAQINEKTLVSNQKLFIENCIREKENLAKIQNEKAFINGVKTLDNNADANIIVRLSKLHKDSFYTSKLKVPATQWNHWEFFDISDAGQPVYSGMAVVTDSLNSFVTSFGNLPVSSNNSKQFVPYSASEMISFSFDDVAEYFKRYTTYFNIAEASDRKISEKLVGLKSFTFFNENANNALILSFENADDFMGEEPVKINSFGDFNVYKCADKQLVSKHFSKLIPNFQSKFYVAIEQNIILSDNIVYLQKVINDYQNHSTFVNEASYKKIAAELPDYYSIEMYKSNISIDGNHYLSARTYNGEKDHIFVNYILNKKGKSTQSNMVEQVLSFNLKDETLTTPQLVYNHKTKQYNIIYQNADKELTLVNLQGKTLWKTKIKGKIIGKIQQVDLFRNHKLQYTFVTPHNWYVIDRLGRKVAGFPEYFMQQITQGISMFDYNSNRKYRFGITQHRKFRLYNNKGKKVKGFKVKTEEDIVYPPDHFRIDNKDFIVMQDDEGKLYLLNRRGEVRIKTNEKFHTTINRWGAYNHKFVNIDDNQNIVSINLKGKVKKAKMELKKPILSRIKSQNLVAVSGNKLLINKKITKIDLGEYSRPFVAKNRKNVYVLLSNADNHKIYGFDKNGNKLSKFPIIGDQIIDVKVSDKGNYILAYDNQKNLIVYKF